MCFRVVDIKACKQMRFAQFKHNRRLFNRAIITPLSAALTVKHKVRIFLFIYTSARLYHRGHLSAKTIGRNTTNDLRLISLALLRFMAIHTKLVYTGNGAILLTLYHAQTHALTNKRMLKHKVGSVN